MPKKSTVKAQPILPTNSVTIRMFCQGLGDCFLITMPQAAGRPYSILIDCGVAMGTPNSDKNMPAVVSKIAELTDGIVDLLVITHEHWDHVSGFLQASKEMKAKLKFQHLWWAWTEDPKDKLAQELKQKYGKARLAVSRAFQMATKLDADPTSRKQLTALNSVLAFHGIDLGLGVGKGKGDIREAMAMPAQLVRATAGEEAIETLMPGKQLPLPGKGLTGTAVGVRAYVLGPPHAADKVKNINPSKKDPQTYGKSAVSHAADDGLGVNWAWMAAAMTADLGRAGLQGTVDDVGHIDQAKPFDPKEQIEIKAAESHTFFADRYFDKTPENEGRRIDGDWLWTGAQKLALQLESYTNNVSLVLAFELPQSKKVLLFAGDAQVGNWLSWHDQDYLADDGRRVTATDLLSRTILYKVGHHGSHNATLRQKGLELMTHPDLVAMLPVETDAVKRLGYGEMPLQSLVNALKNSTQNRVLRLDELWAGDTAPGTWRPKMNQAKLSTETLDVITDKKPAKRPLYMEYVICDGQAQNAKPQS